ncbi:MAG TPA: metallophosphoesterase, partial [Herpetosiphonaceae bacterium]
AYVTPTGGGEIVLGRGLAFRTSQSSVASLDQIVVAAGSNGSSITGCNFWFSPNAPAASPVLVGAGDIALCDSAGTPVASTRATAALLDAIPGTVFTTGDNAYNSGTPTEFQQCYDPTWGRHKTRTRPTPGNHEYGTSGASGYFGYFGALAGDPGKGYYSYNLGQWHIIALNSNCSALGNGSTSAGCGSTSAQATWLQQDLAANAAGCTLAYWHHPRWSSGAHGSSTAMSAIWQMLYDAGADVVLAGHDHNYERFAPLNGSGAVDTARGIRQFVVGTGGAALRSVGTLLPTSERFHSSTHGVLKLTLHATSFDWQFVPAAGSSFTDQGSGTCH